MAGFIKLTKRQEKNRVLINTSKIHAIIDHQDWCEVDMGHDSFSYVVDEKYAEITRLIVIAE